MESISAVDLAELYEQVSHAILYHKINLLETTEIELELILLRDYISDIISAFQEA
jgi:hypothetical protein